MEVIDEEGRLFGVVNVVDAVALLLVVAVVVAGASLVLGGGEDPTSEPTPEPTSKPTPEPELENRTVSLAVGQVSPAVAALVDPGPVTVAGTSATITDVYVTPGSGESALVFVRLRLPGQATEAGFLVAGSPVRYGRKLVVDTPEYRLTGRVDALGAEETFGTVTRAVTVEANVSRAIAGAVTAGDSQRVGDITVATVTDVEVTGGNDDRRTISVTLEIRGRLDGETLTYAGQPVRLGSRLRVRTARYQFTGEVVGLDDG